jgi:hypothetical protein
MALSGSKSVTVTQWDILTLSWAQVGQSVADNTTTVSWTLQLQATAYGYLNAPAVATWSVSIDGNSYTGTNTVAIANNTTKTLASGTTVIKHNDDGTKDFAYTFSQQFNVTFSGQFIGTVSGDGSGTLEAIPQPEPEEPDTPDTPVEPEPEPCAPKNFRVTVRDKVATVQGSPCIICGNSDYSLTFDFVDPEWSEHEERTARFTFIKRGELRYDEVIFEGNTVSVPVLSDIDEVVIGVYTGELYTTTPARIKCKRSILCKPAINERQIQTAYQQVLKALKEIYEKLEKLGVSAGDLVFQVGGVPLELIQQGTAEYEEISTEEV